MSLTFAAVPPTDDVSISVDIAPLDTSCTVACAPEPPTGSPGGPALPVTGGEVVSLALPIALLVAGVVATLWSRRQAKRA